MKQLQSFLKRNNISQNEFASDIGVDRSTIVRYFSGRVFPTTDFKDKVINGLTQRLEREREKLNHLENEVKDFLFKFRIEFDEDARMFVKRNPKSWAAHHRCTCGAGLAATSVQYEKSNKQGEVVADYN